VKLTFLLPTAAVVLSIASFRHVAHGDEAPDETPQVIILKLDDVTNHGANGVSPVSPRWRRVTDFRKKRNLKASFGIIGVSLEEDNQAYFDWIKTLHESSLIEFWNHGYRNRKATDMKGWELCIWQQDGDTYFSLMVGTNRLKNEREIAQTAVKGLDAIKLKLAELKAGQHVFLGGRRSTDRAPDDQSKVVAEYCTKIGLKVRR